MCYSLNSYLGISNHKHTRSFEISAALLFTHFSHQLLLLDSKGVVLDTARMPVLQNVYHHAHTRLHIHKHTHS